MKKVLSIKQSEIIEKWYIVDAANKRIGTLASKVATLLMGKNNTLARSNLKPLNHVVIINSVNIDFTPKRAITKFYKNYSGFPGGLRFTSLEDLHKKHPAFPIESAIRGMLPKTKRGEEMFSNLRVYPGADHKHTAQNPEIVNL